METKVQTVTGKKKMQTLTTINVQTVTSNQGKNCEWKPEYKVLLVIKVQSVTGNQSIISDCVTQYIENLP